MYILCHSTHGNEIVPPNQAPPWLISGYFQRESLHRQVGADTCMQIHGIPHDLLIDNPEVVHTTVFLQTTVRYDS